MQSLYWTLAIITSRVSAQVFNGPGLSGGIDEASNISGPVHMSLRDFLLSILYKVLNFLALAAVVMLVIAGIMLIFSLGSDTTKDTAKKTVIYVIIGLIIILLARAVVGFFMYALP